MADEKRLIDANALFKAIKADKVAWRFGVPNTLGLLFDKLRIIIKEQPTIDAEEAVRCKDCKSWEQYNACDGTKPHRCMNSDSVFYKRTAPDFFCAYGERKDNDNK